MSAKYIVWVQFPFQAKRCSLIGKALFFDISDKGSNLSSGIGGSSIKGRIVCCDRKDVGSIPSITEL